MELGESEEPPRLMSAVALILHADQTDDAVAIRSQVSAQCEAAYFDPTLVECLDDVPDDLTGIEACVYLCSTAALASAELQEALAAVLAHGLVVLPIRRAEDAIGDVVHAQLTRINALTWEPSGHDAAAYLLEAVGLAEAERKVFVSYRRDDAAAIAEQLWVRLSQRGFDVFLDRFAIPPGADFQRRIDLELSDKAFVVLIESPRVAESIWVQYEYLYAITHSIGLKVLTLPGTAPLVAFEEAWRRHILPEEIESPPAGSKLADASLDEVIRDIETSHTAALARRKERILRSAEVEVTAAGWTLERLSDWSFIASRGKHAEIVRVTPRAPRPLDLLRLDRLRSQLLEGGILAAGADARLVHAAEDMDPMWIELNEWVAESRSLATTLLALLPDSIA